MTDTNGATPGRHGHDAGLDLTWAVAAPALLVFLWSTGFVAAKWGLPHAEPFTFVTIRFALAALLLAVIAVIVRAPWPTTWTEIGHTAVVGVLLHGIYLTGVFYSISRGAPAWITSLLTAVHPPLTALLAGPYLNERVTGRQWLGLALGVTGVFLVVWRGGSLLAAPPESLVACAIGLLALSGGALYQKRHATTTDLRTGLAIQLTAACLLTAPLAFAFETRVIDWNPAFVGALAWLTVVLSTVMFGLLFVLIRRGAAAKVASLFFLVPPVVALEAYALFGEQVSLQQAAGMAMAMAGVALVTRQRA